MPDLDSLSPDQRVSIRQAARNLAKELEGTFAEETIDTGGGTTPFDATGVFVAKNFTFSREYASRTAGSERVTFDARVILNPPPGLSDATRSLPGFRSTSGR